MLLPAKKLKEKIASGSPVIGMMAMDHVWPLLVDLCMQSGLDYLIVDCEHGSHSDEQVERVCHTARLAQFPVLVRAISCEPSVLRRIMDLGACGLILPCVDDVDQVEAIQEAVLMPPRGKRRPGGMGNYWMRDIQYANWREEFEAHVIVIPQIETRAGVENAAVIAAHPLVTALGLGPYDLAADLGCCWDPENPEHKASVRRITEAANSAGKKLWIGIDGPKLRAEGHTFLWIGTESTVLRRSLSATVQAINEK